MPEQPDISFNFVDEAKVLPYRRIDKETENAMYRIGFAGNGFEVRQGLTLAYAEDIIEMAKQPHIKHFCPEDSQDRFSSLQSASRWLGNLVGGAVFTLVELEGVGDESNRQRLAGYGWTRHELTPKLPNSETQLSIRIGEDARDNKLATDFVRIIVGGSKLIGAKNFWLKTRSSNIHAVQAYEKAGFETVYEDDSNDVWPEEPRKYMVRC